MFGLHLTLHRNLNFTEVSLNCNIQTNLRPSLSQIHIWITLHNKNIILATNQWRNTVSNITSEKTSII